MTVTPCPHRCHKLFLFLSCKVLFYYNWISLMWGRVSLECWSRRSTAGKHKIWALLLLRQFGQFSFKTAYTVTAGGAGHLAQQGFSPVDGQPVGRKESSSELIVWLKNMSSNCLLASWFNSTAGVKSSLDCLSSRATSELVFTNIIQPEKVACWYYDDNNRK